MTKCHRLTKEKERELGSSDERTGSSVWERNARAIAFYERWGFRIVGDHIFQLGADAQRDLIMERHVHP